MGVLSLIRGLYNSVGDKLEKAKEWIQDKYKKAKEISVATVRAINRTIKDWEKPDKPSPDWGDVRPKTPTSDANPPTGGGNRYISGYKPSNEYEAKNLINRRTSILERYHKEARKEAVAFEDMARQTYCDTYFYLLSTLDEVMDTRAIESFIDKKSKTFMNQMRDEINSKISIGNRHFNMLLDDTTLKESEYNRKIQDYADSAFQTAKDNLLSTLQQLINETNNYIRVNANKFLQDEQEMLNVLRNNLNQLTKEGEMKQRELERISYEYATLLLIKELSKQKFD